MAVDPGAEIVVRFLSARDDRHRGLFLGTIGMLEIPETGACHDQFLVEFDPDRPCMLRVVKTDGSLRFYPAVSDEYGHPQTLLRNQCLAQTSADEGTLTYTCADPGRTVTFGVMEFSISVRPPAP